MRTPSFCCLFVATFTTLPNLPTTFLDNARQELFVTDKIASLRQVLADYPTDPIALQARAQLVELLSESNQYEEALTLYQEHQPVDASTPVDFRLADYFLKTGRFTDVLRTTSVDLGPTRDFPRDQRILELQIQAYLAKGRYRAALSALTRWMAVYKGDGLSGSRYESDVRGLLLLQRQLATLVRVNGEEGDAVFTASMPDRLQRFSRTKEVPIVFVKVLPAHPSGQLKEPLLPGSFEDDTYFISKVDEMNKMFAYVSGDLFSLRMAGIETVYVKPGDLDSGTSGGSLLTSRIYAQTVPVIARQAGQAFVVLVDYRARATDEVASLGDGIIHLSASKFEPLVTMHEILHGLGATHQEWNPLENLGYRFDPDDRGLMTFENGEIKNLGLEEKNRAVLGWPRVAVIHLSGNTHTLHTEDEVQTPAPTGEPAQTPVSRETKNLVGLPI